MTLARGSRSAQQLVYSRGHRALPRAALPRGQPGSVHQSRYHGQVRSKVSLITLSWLIRLLTLTWLNKKIMDLGVFLSPVEERQ